MSLQYLTTGDLARINAINRRRPLSEGDRIVVYAPAELAPARAIEQATALLEKEAPTASERP